MYKNFAFFLIWTCIILYLSFTPLPTWPAIKTLDQLAFDKLVHIGMYSVLSFSLFFGLFRQNHSVPKSLFILICIIYCALFGITIEILQPILTNYRQFEVMDMVANSIGSITGYFLFRLMLKKNWLGLKMKGS